MLTGHLVLVVPYTSKYPSMSQEKYTTSVHTAFAYICCAPHVILQGAIMPQCTGAPLTRRGKQGRADGAQFAPASQHNEHTITRTCKHKCKHAPLAYAICCMHSKCALHIAHDAGSMLSFQSSFPKLQMWLALSQTCTPFFYVMKEYLFYDMNVTIRQL